MEYGFVETDIVEDLGHALSPLSFEPVREMTVDEAFEHLDRYPNDMIMAFHVQDLIEKKGIKSADVARFSSNPAFVSSFMTAKTLSYDEEQKLSVHPDPSVRAYVKNKRENGMLNRLAEIENSGARDSRAMGEYLSILSDLAGDEMTMERVGIQSIPFGIENSDHDLGTSLREHVLGDTYKIIAKESIVEKLGVIYIKTMETMGTHGSGIVRRCRISSPDMPMTITGLIPQGGKGVTEKHAIVSALMETVERFSAEMRSLDGWPSYYESDPCLIKGRYSEMTKDFEDVLDPNRCAMNCRYDDEAIYWARGNMHDGREIYVPADRVFYPLFVDAPFFGSDTSGISSGNTINDAKLQSLLEIIERDSHYHSYSKKDYRLAAGDGLLSNVLGKYDECGMDLMLRESTSEFGIPVFEAYSYLGSSMVHGYGADLNAKRAIIRAVCELNCQIAGLKDMGLNIKGSPPNELKKYPVLDIGDVPDFSSGSVRQDVNMIEKLMEKNGYDVIYADLTVKDIGIPVVRSIIPGLEAQNYSRRIFSHLHEAVKNKYCS